MKEEAQGLACGELGLDDGFRFRCDSRMECFLKCCTGVQVWLTPYDIIRMKTALAMTSSAFLEQYTQTRYSESDGYPVVKLHMPSAGAGRCPFAEAAGCLVYGDRPWVCRLFPLVPANGNMRTTALADEDAPRFDVHRWDQCRGIDRGDSVTIREWRDRQGLVVYEAVHREWEKLTHHPAFRNCNLREGETAERFRLGCYDIDRFRRSVFTGVFREEFDAARELPNGSGTDDTELLLFAFRWLRQGLPGLTPERPRP